MTNYLLLIVCFGSISLNATSRLLSLMPQWSQKTLLEDVTYAQIFGFGLLLLFGIGIRFLVRFLFQKQLIHVFSRLNFHYLETLMKKATTPLGNLAMAAFWAIFIANLDLNPSILAILEIALRIFAGLSFVMLAYRAMDVIASYITQKSHDKGMSLSIQLVPLFSRAMKIIIVILGGLFVLQNLNVDITSLLAGMTIGGLAFSFAAKDTVANIFGSVTIFTDQSFKVGDWIKIGDVEGIVISVGFRSTRIKTFYNSVITIPNSKFTDSIVDNMSLREYRKNTTELGLVCDTSAEQIDVFCQGLREILEAHPKTQKNTSQVYFYDYTDSALNIVVKFNIQAQNQSEELNYRHQILLDFMRLAQKMGIQFAFPTRTLFIHQQS